MFSLQLKCHDSDRFGEQPCFRVKFSILDIPKYKTKIKLNSMVNYSIYLNKMNGNRYGRRIPYAK